MKKRLLIVDGQLFQTEARDRGMGRYSSRLIKSLIDQKHYNKVRIIVKDVVYNKHIYEDDLNTTFPGIEIVTLDLKDTLTTKIELARSHNKKELNRYILSIEDENYTIDYLIPSPFQEPAVSVFPDGVKKILVFYDLIPYLYHHRYRPLMHFEDYLKRFTLLFEADKILTISRSVLDDLAVYLGIDRNRMAAIDGAAIKSDSQAVRPKGVDIPDRYILMPTSDDPRKNNLRAVLGFEEFRASQFDDYKLVITSKIHKSERDKLTIFSKKLIFTGNLIESELDWLYAKCDAVLFVPESEGLGLPILEAVLANKRVICSSIPAFKEISDDAFYYCEHENQHSIAEAITRACATDSHDIQELKYKSIQNHYTWKQTAKRSIGAIDGVTRREIRKRPRLAIFVPAPDGLSAVGKVVAEAHPTMVEYFDIDYYAETGQYSKFTRPNYLQYIANYFPAESFGVEDYIKYDAVLYHVGNSDYHVESIRNSLYLPGYVILHDTNIGEAYRIMCERNMISSDRRDLEALIADQSAATTSSYIASVVNYQLGILTHSQYAAGAVRDIIIDKATPVISGNLATQCSSTTEGRDYSQMSIGLAGIIADIKGISVVEMLASNSAFAHCTFRLFGYNYATPGTINRLNSHPNVTVSTDLTDFEFYNNIGKLDIFVNYRMKYQGETSLSTLEAMRQGVVVIVRNIGWYAELPDDTVVKVNSEVEVTDRLMELMSDHGKLAKISKKAKQYIQKHHSQRQYAETIASLIGRVDPPKTNAFYIASELRTGSVKTSLQLTEILVKDRSTKGEVL